MCISLKNKKKLQRKNTGFTIVELIVVLSIFAVLASIILFNYQKFLSKVNIKVLANDIALKLVEVQKNATSGKQNTLASSTWKPSYGLYFNLASGANTGNKVFYSFVDLNQNKVFDVGGYVCPNNECVEKINLTKNNTISELRVVNQDNTFVIVQDLQMTFTRPNYGATLRSSSALSPNASYAQITVASPDGSLKAVIKLYVSGRIQIN